MKPREGFGGFGGRIGAIVLTLAVVLLTGCKTTGPATQSSANLHDQEPHLLFRVVCIDATTNQLRLTCDVQVNLWRLGDADGKIAVLPKKFSPHESALSKSSTDQGWRDIAVEPGTYCMEILPTDRDPTVAFDETNRPVYFLKVSTNQLVAYAGTVVFNRRVRKHKSFLDSSKSTEFSLKDFWNETEAARGVAGLAGLGDVTSCLLVPYDAPSMNQQSGLAQVRSGAVATLTIGGNQSHLDSIMTSPAMVPGEVLMAAGGHSGEAGIYVVGAGLALMAVGAPVALTTEAIKTHAHHKKWAPYQAALQKEVGAFHLDERLREQLAAALGAETNSAAQALWLQIEPYRVVLRGDQRQKFALEIAVRVQLFNSAKGGPIWEHSYVTDSHDSYASFELCETPVWSSISLHRLEDFSGDSGAKLMRIELQAAVEDLTHAISSRINEPNQSSSSLANEFALPTQPTAF